jgi:High potential iron-sulfur protein
MKDDNKHALSRRRVLKVAIALGVVTPLLASRLALANRVDKKTAHYQNHPKGNHYCGDCDFYIKPTGDSKLGSCQLVQGNISRNGWCEFYMPEED